MLAANVGFYVSNLPVAEEKWVWEHIRQLLSPPHAGLRLMLEKK
jgi:hypothetical protein